MGKRRFFDAWVRGEAGNVFATHPSSAEDRRKSVLRAERPLLPEVADALNAFNARFPPSPARDAHLEALRSGAAAVVTGQQVGLFLGPLFTVYKAATAVCAARALSSEIGRPVVPVFWLQAEDHDLPEVASTQVATRDGELRTLRLTVPESNRVSVEHVSLSDDVSALLPQLEDLLRDLPEAESHLSLLERHYVAGAGWVDAFAGVLAELFADDGLVLVNPRTPELARVVANVHRSALTRSAHLAALLTDRARWLEEQGYATTVHVREGAPLSFFHPDGVDGPRFRLESIDGGFKEIGGEGTHSLESLLARLDEEPRSFSTSALLRPIVQDTLLPTAAYVGGPAEVAYFAQLAPLYPAFDLPMPLVMARARRRVIEGRTERLLSKLGLEADDALCPEDELLSRCTCLDDRIDLRRVLLEPFEEALRTNEEAIRGAGPGLDSAIERTLGTVQVAVQRLEEKYGRAVLRRDEGRVEEVRKLRRLLCPGGIPQERVHGLDWYAARYGARAFVEAVLDTIDDPFDPTPRDVRP